MSVRIPFASPQMLIGALKESGLFSYPEWAPYPFYSKAFSTIAMLGQFFLVKHSFRSFVTISPDVYYKTVPLALAVLKKYGSWSVPFSCLTAVGLARDVYCAVGDSAAPENDVAHYKRIDVIASVILGAVGAWSYMHLSQLHVRSLTRRVVVNGVIGRIVTPILSKIVGASSYVIKVLGVL